MASKPLVFRFVLGILLAASLACNAVTNLGSGRGSDVNNAQATARAASTQASAAATAAANIGVDPTDEPDDIATDVPDISTAVPGFDEGPEDVPVFTDGEVSDFFGSPELMSYFVDAEFGDVRDFYKDEMTANGWEADNAASFEVEGLAILSYNKDSRNAIITITPDPTSGRTTVLIGVTTSN